MAYNAGGQFGSHYSRPGTGPLPLSCQESAGFIPPLREADTAMTNEIEDLRELKRLVRSALAHLYDFAYLQNHPLATMLDAGGDLDQMTRAQQVRRALLGCLEHLHPRGSGQASCTYAVLTYRYVDGLSVAEIMHKLALSRRQFYREYAKGLEAITSLLADRLPARSRQGQAPALAGEGDRLQVAHAETQLLRQAVRPERLDLECILRGVLALLAPRIQQAGSQVTVSPAGPWPPVAADRVMLRQALLNLLSHGVDAVGQGELALTVSVVGGNLGIEASSTLRAPASEPDRSRSQQASVQLAVARSLIEAQGGRLEVQAGPHRWSARVTLPLFGQRAILVIDDNANLVALLQRYLAGRDLRVVGATKSEEALHLAAELQPQLITLDLMMPNQDGWEILQRLKASPATRGIPVVICSVLHEPQMARALGASDYITKPVRQDDLLAVLRRWLGPLTAGG